MDSVKIDPSLFEQWTIDETPSHTEGKLVMPRSMSIADVESMKDVMETARNQLNTPLPYGKPNMGGGPSRFIYNRDGILWKLEVHFSPPTLVRAVKLSSDS